MCGIVGIVGKSNVNQALYDALTVLQHRGGRSRYRDQPRWAAVSAQGQRPVRDVFQQRHMQRTVGNMGIGHIRYPTAGSSSSAEAQPFYVNSPYGITLAHNGNLTNVDQLTKEIYESDLRHVNTSSDSEVLLNVFAHELAVRGKLQPTEEDVFAAVSKVHERCRGGYAVVAMVTGYGIVGFRDPNAIRPIVFGQRHTDEGVEYMIASESVSLDVLGFTLIRDRRLARRCTSQPTASCSPVSAPMHRSLRPASSSTLHGAFRLPDGRGFGVQGSSAHGREAGRQDSARASGP